MFGRRPGQQPSAPDPYRGGYSNVPSGGGGGYGGGGGGFAPFDPRKAPNERDLVMAMMDAEGGGMMMDYFDRGMLKNWAGPEHWKLRKVVRKREPFVTLDWIMIDFFRSGDYGGTTQSAAREEGSVQDRLPHAGRRRPESAAEEALRARDSRCGD